MTQTRSHFFSLHELLIMAALAALGGMSGSLLSVVGKAVQAAIGLPGGLQSLAGVHVLWLVLALGLIRKPGAATLTGLLKGVAELLSGNPKGLIVVAISLLAGVCVDVFWVLLGRRSYSAAFVLGGGTGAMSSVLVFTALASLHGHRALDLFVTVLAVIAFVSGALLAGVLGWSLLHALQRAGVIGAPPPPPKRGEWRTWVTIGIVGTVTMAVGVVDYTMRAHAATMSLAPPIEHTTPAGRPSP